MGHIVVYCDTCGERILEGQIAKGKAFASGGRYFCLKCKPADLELPAPAPPVDPAFAEATADRTPPTRTGPVPTAAPPRRVGAPAPKSKTPIIVGVGGAGILVVILLVFALSGGKNPPDAAAPGNSGPPISATPPPKNDQPGKTEKPAVSVDEKETLIRDLEQFADQNPDHPRQILERCASIESKLQESNYYARFKLVRSKAKEKLAQLEPEKTPEAESAQTPKPPETELKVPETPKTETKTFSADEAEKHSGEKVTIEYTIVQVGTSKDMTFLNSKKHRSDSTDFVAFIPKDARADFVKVYGEDLKKALEGKKVRVTGEVMLYKKAPEIVLKSPDQLKIVP